MGMQDQDGCKNSPEERAEQAVAKAGRRTKGPVLMFFFWLGVIGLLYAGMTHYLKPRPVVISANGDLVIPRARDGHFYAAGLVNGKPVNFMVDTGASLVTVSEQFAKSAGLAGGTPTRFRTANGDLPGRIISGVPVALGPLGVSSVRVGVGLVGANAGDALLGQSFLSRFDLLMSGEQMVLRPKQPGALVNPPGLRAVPALLPPAIAAPARSGQN